MPSSLMRRARRGAATNDGDVLSVERSRSLKMSNIMAKKADDLLAKPETPTHKKVAKVAKAHSYEPVDPNTAPGMTEMQRNFIANVAVGMSATQAARHAGYKMPRDQGRQMLAVPKIAAAVEGERAQYEEAGRMTKKRVMDGFLDAISDAKTLSDPIAQIAGWREIAKMCGYFEPQKHQIEVSVNGNLVVQKIQAMSDAELLRLAHGEVIEGEIIPDDGSSE
jgi:hypothetical protein